MLKQCLCGRSFEPNSFSNGVMTIWGNKYCDKCVEKKLNIALKKLRDILIGCK
jgi:hypothetical protein